MNKTIYQILLFVMLSFTCNAQQEAPNGKPDFDFYIINLIKADWTINCSTLRYVNSHDEGTMYIVDVKDKYHRFIEKICKQHKDSMCLLAKEENYCAVYKPYEANYKLYDKLIKNGICLLPYSKVQPLLDDKKRVIVKSRLSDEKFAELYKTYGIVYVEKKVKEKRSNR